MSHSPILDWQSILKFVKGIFSSGFTPCAHFMRYTLCLCSNFPQHPSFAHTHMLNADFL